MITNERAYINFKLDGENVEAFGRILAYGETSYGDETLVPEEIVDLRFDEFYSLDKDEIEGELAVNYLPRLNSDYKFYEKVCKAILSSPEIKYEFDTRH